MIYSHEVEEMCTVNRGASHGCAPIPEEGKWVYSREIKDISGLTHGIGWCAPQQGACKLTLNVKEGIIEEALIETVGCSGMTHSAAMASEALVGKTLLEGLNTDLVCDAINTAMRELFLQIVYGRTQSAFSEGGLPVGAGLPPATAEQHDSGYTGYPSPEPFYSPLRWCQCRFCTAKHPVNPAEDQDSSPLPRLSCNGWEVPDTVTLHRPDCRTAQFSKARPANFRPHRTVLQKAVPVLSALPVLF